MPIYEYQCSACRHKLERIQKLNDEPLKVCPICEKPELVKLVSASGFRLKGSGWYETDFKSKGKKNVVDSEGGSGGGDNAGSSADSKSAEKGEKSDQSQKSDKSEKSDKGDKPTVSSTPVAPGS